MPLFMDEVPENVADAPEFEALQQLAYMEGSPDELLKQVRHTAPCATSSRHVARYSIY